MDQNYDNLRKMVSPNLGERDQVRYHDVWDFEWTDPAGPMFIKDPAMVEMTCPKCERKIPTIHFMNHESSCNGDLR